MWDDAERERLKTPESDSCRQLLEQLALLVGAATNRPSLRACSISWR